MESSENRAGAHFTILRATLTRDRVVKLSLAVAAAACLFLSYLPAGQRASFGAVSLTAAFAVLVIFAVRAVWGRARAVERRFWRDLMIAYGLWLGIAVLFLWSGVSAVPIPTRLAAEIGTALFYVLFVRAVESQPHRR
ncbi:MAG: hypothetical protein GY929_17095, partial [Actinomycetia bacterium]|nr:hypothetical protein [Actinomycetes bacterium]